MIEQILLAAAELDEAIHSTECKQLIISARIDYERRKIYFLSGDFRIVEIDFDSFQPSGTETPDFNKIAIADYGCTVRFGTYEASSASILFPKLK